ncbi:MAG TPA: RagB/SusD family nutrient uptake outer membrane protein [Paludibacter sp.]|nr:RagB/SusD family nutrient uptake outer membrane protein [Paludibacter sp.]
MKIIKTIRHIILALSVFILNGCSNFLEVETVGRVTIPNFYSDMDGMRSGLAGMYSEMYNYYSSEFYKYPEIAGNMVDIKAVSQASELVDQYNFTSDPEQETGAVGYIWRKILVAMANVNNMLYYQPDLLIKFPAHADELNQIKAQALFMRALCHFDLCRTYAQPYNYSSDASHLGVPVLLKTPGPDDNVSRATVKQVYDQIIKDLLESEKLFGTTTMTDSYHISKKATQALLSRVYMYMGDWDNCIKYSTEVINSSELAYGNDYLAMYNNLIAGKEAIFRLNGSLKSVKLGQFYSSSTPAVLASDTLISLFKDTTDIRFDLFKRDITTSSKYLTLKYNIKVSYTTTTERYDPFILRVSEMYLNRAEAYLNKNELQNAADDIKVIIARSLNKAINEVVVNSGNKSELALLIDTERVKELSFEGHNFFDITRRKQDLVRGRSTYSNVKMLTYPNDLFILPIPQTELNANTNMIGNPTVNN